MNKMQAPGKAIRWRKSSRSSSGGDAQNCVEIGATHSEMAFRDSTLGAASPILTLETSDYNGFLKHFI